MVKQLFLPILNDVVRYWFHLLKSRWFELLLLNFTIVSIFNEAVQIPKLPFLSFRDSKVSRKFHTDHVVKGFIGFHGEFWYISKDFSHYFWWFLSQNL
jgi:hypothetical protein